MFTPAPISQRVKDLKIKRKEHDQGHVILNMERTKIYTDYYKLHEWELPLLKRAGALKTWCENCTVRLEDDEIFVANLGPDWRCTSPYVEWGVGWMKEALALPEDVWYREWGCDGVFAYVSPEAKKIWQEAVEYWEPRTIQATTLGDQPEGITQLIGDNCTSFGNRSRANNKSANPIPPSDRVPELANIMRASDICQGHYSPDYKKIIDRGWKSLRDEAQAHMDAIEGKVFHDDASKYVFWRAMVRVAEGGMILTKRYADLVAKAAEEAPEGARKDELAKMADGLYNIVENPARNTWESMQCTLIYQLMLHTDGQSHGITLGRMDQYLGKFVEQELADGVYTEESLQELTDLFILKLGDYFSVMRVVTSPTGTLATKSAYNYVCGGQHFTVGGVTPEGEDATNPLTLTFLQTYARLYLIDPSISVRMHDNTPYEVWEAAIESSKISGGMPIIENDNVIIPALEAKGISHEDANDYAIIGCVEPAIGGKEWSASGSNGCESFVNLVGIMNMAIHNGRNPMPQGLTPNGNDFGPKTGDLRDMKSFEELKEAFVKQIEFWVDWHVSYVNFYELAYGEFFPCVSASLTMEGCMDSGKDVLRGGAKYNSTGLTGAGIGNVADSLCAIKKLVFEDKTVTADQLLDALNKNWEGYEELQQYIDNELPHYGNDIEEVDEIAAWAMGVFCDKVNSSWGPRGPWRPSTFTMTVHIDFGRQTMATPDGRFLGTPLAEAISPRQGFDKNGPTAYLTSAAKLPQVKLGNGDQCNIKFSPSVCQGEQGTRHLQQLISTYFDQGGMQVQFNVVGVDTLHDAQEHPEDHQNLIVRIAGFSAYFVEMPKVLQDDFITRTEHEG